MVNDPKENDALGRQAADASAQIAARKAARAAQSGAGANPEPPAKGDTFTQFITRNILYILSAAAVVAVAFLLVIVVAPFATGGLDDQAFEDAYVSPYDWSKLDRTDGRYAYVDNGQVRSRLGIDVSENQHAIDWSAVRADGIDFAMIRLGYRGATAGDLYLDEYYEANMEGAREAGVARGVYFFSQANTPEEGREEADFVLAHLNGAPLEYPVAFDSEEEVLGLPRSRVTDLDNATMSSIADAFCKRIEEGGYSTVVYGNAQDISRFRRSSLQDKQLWWAEYGVEAPTGKIDIDIWQYSNAGQVDGIQGAVDMDIDLRPVLNPSQE